MLIKQYFMIYTKLVEGHVNKLLSWGTAVLFGGIFAVLFYMFQVDIVLKAVPLAIFLLHIISIFMNGNQRESIEALFVFLQKTPIHPFKIVILNGLCKLFNQDKMRFYFFNFIVLVIFKVPALLIALYFFRILSLIFISQMVEYIVYIAKRRYFWHFLIPIIFLFFLLFLENEKPYFLNFHYYAAHFSQTRLYDSIILLSVAISLVAAPVFVNKLLIVKKPDLPIGIRRLSNVISRLSYIAVFNPQLQNIIKTSIKIYIRDQSVLLKYWTITVLSIVYSWGSYAVQGANDEISSFYLVFMMSCYFFYEVRMLRLFRSNSIADRFPVPNRQKTMSDDFVAGCLNILFSWFALVVYCIFFKIHLSVMLANMIISIFLYNISLYFKAQKSPAKKYVIFSYVKYIILSLFLGLILLHAGILLSILALVVFGIFTYYKIYREGIE
ncbi:hypothetical protein [Anoxybacteroides tepidamans]|uniref:hypothetical protein n=1 Tax=Anoxybacteroides tepidamans TaxID=265948 RepID=UPI000482D7E7|nr:hypothetical protein [Anoxybacillus tepidamans]